MIDFRLLSDLDTLPSYLPAVPPVCIPDWLRREVPIPAPTVRS
jgi:hypothetical protein